MIALLLSWAALAVTTPGSEIKADAPANYVARDWTNASGTQHVRATLLRVEEDKLWLRRPNGVLATAALSQLSEADRQYVATHSAAGPSRSEPHSIVANLTNRIVSKVGDGAQTIATLPSWSQSIQS